MAIVDDSLSAQYQREGFLTIENLLSNTELENLRKRMAEIAEGRIPTFSTDHIEYEPNAQGSRDGTTIRKINHCAENDDIFMNHAANSKILDVVRKGYQAVWKSMFYEASRWNR